MISTYLIDCLRFLLNWHWINLITPFLGIGFGIFILINNATCTKRKAISSAIALSILMWLMLLWADWGSGVFVPSYQTMLARIILTIITILVVFELKFYTRINRSLRVKNIRLGAENRKLKLRNSYLETDDHNKHEGQ